MTPEVIIFDADHTLYTPVGRRAYPALFAAMADTAAVPPEEARSTWEEYYPRCREEWNGGEDYRRAAIRRTLAALGAEPDPGEVRELQDRFWSRVAEDITVEDGTRTMLERFADRYTLALATDELPGPLQRKMAAALGGMELFDTVVTAREVETLKPSERFCTLILDQYKVAPGDVVMVGDSWARDLAPAAELGMATVHLTEEETQANHRIQRITDLPTVLGGA